MLSVKVRPGLREEYEQWQSRVIDAASEFSGFEAAEVHPPASAEGSDWVVAFRFSHPEALMTWMGSETRKSLLEEGDPLLQDHRIQDVLIGGAPTRRENFTAVIGHDVRPGHEDGYRHWRNKVLKDAGDCPGYAGSEAFSPVRGVQERWVMLVRFDSRLHLEKWMESDAYAKQLDAGRQHFATHDVRKVPSSFSGWFRFDEETASGAPPNWKQAFAILLALYPVVMIMALFLVPVLNGIGALSPLYIQGFIQSALAVGALTWILMPVVNRGLTFWLIPGRSRTTTLQVAGTGIVVLGWIVFLVVFGLATR
ncbi:hypothetical protein VT52_021390 [Streptomyces malaysiense]|uniref:Antibiotic biosynthesis monooxygenase n=2 Tax=Streptomyces malaysiense TaxID=1428626 RepID=A0A1J4PXZ9_9ACTN|nr:hypothetical protein VT52_021390 [Streptomyces malaysiense]